jgi:hypothetical protein
MARLAIVGSSRIADGVARAPAGRPVALHWRRAVQDRVAVPIAHAGRLPRTRYARRSAGSAQHHQSSVGRPGRPCQETASALVRSARSIQAVTMQPRGPRSALNVFLEPGTQPAQGQPAQRESRDRAACGVEMWETSVARRFARLQKGGKPPDWSGTQRAAPDPQPYVCRIDPKHRLPAGIGRERTNCLGGSNGHKQTFVLGYCRRHEAPIADVRPTIPAPIACGTNVVAVLEHIGCDDFRKDPD